MGVQEIILYSVRFSIISDYFAKDKVSSMTSYIEFCWFIACCLGQIIGSGLIVSHRSTLVYLLLGGGLLCMASSYFLYPTSYTTTKKIAFYWNPFKDSWLMLSRLFQQPRITLIVFMTAWFWCFTIISSTQFSLFVANYVDNNPHLFTLFLAADAIGIAIGSILCAKCSRGQVLLQTISKSGVIMSIATLFILVLYSSRTTVYIDFFNFLSSPRGIILVLIMVIKSIAAGFYSQTCYTEAQLISNSTNRSQVMMAISMSAAFLTLLASIFCSILEPIIRSKGILIGVCCLNLLIICAFIVNRKKIN